MVVSALGLGTWDLGGTVACGNGRDLAHLGIIRTLSTHTCGYSMSSV